MARLFQSIMVVSRRWVAAIKSKVCSARTIMVWPCHTTGFFAGTFRSHIMARNNHLVASVVATHSPQRNSTRLCIKTLHIHPRGRMPQTAPLISRCRAGPSGITSARSTALAYVLSLNCSSTAKGLDAPSPPPASATSRLASSPRGNGSITEPKISQTNRPI